MDSTPTRSAHTQQQQPISIKPSPRKLPIKRKSPHSTSSNPNPNPNPNPNHNRFYTPIVLPKFESTAASNGDIGGGDRKPTLPFKFHRIWTEPDEIRFLQGLIDCSSEGLSFPKDLNVFYARFSDTMSQPYSKSQLSEKIRRLRKKFRVISSRLARGLDEALLSPHDRALFVLSKQLWHPEFSSASPFGANGKPKVSNLVGVKVSFSPTLNEFNGHSNLNFVYENDEDEIVGGFDDVDDDDVKLSEAKIDGGADGDAKLSDVNIKFEDGPDSVQEHEYLVPIGSSIDLEKVARKTVLDVFDQSLKEARMSLVRQGLVSIEADSPKEGKIKNFEMRWREQQVAEFNVLARRLRLVLEHSLQRQ